MYVLIVGAVWVGVCPHCGRCSLGRCMSSLGAVWVGVCPHVGVLGRCMGRCMSSLWEQFG